MENRKIRKESPFVWKTYQCQWIIDGGDRKIYWWPVRLGWWLGKKAMKFRKSYGARYFWIRRPIVVFLTSFIEANLEER